jgi:C1A family cysteine protease
MTKYGWKPDLPDHRDRVYAAPRRAIAVLPPKVDLRPLCPPVYDQGDLGSCTGNAIAAAFAFAKKKEAPKAPFMTPSRLFVYYNERVMEHTVSQDAGAQIRDGIKSVAKQGVCSESTWPYVPKDFKKKPPKAAYSEALLNQALSYERVLQSLVQMRVCLASGFPFVFGFSVYEGFESDAVAKTGKLMLPGPNEAALGGHAVLCVGYNDAQQRFLVRNSWGAGWARKGYFTMPYEYLLTSNLSDDLWTIRTVE